MSTTRISLALNLLLAIVCVVLLQQNRALKGGGGEHTTSALRPGAHVAPFAYRTLKGQQATLTFDPRQRYLLFVISDRKSVV